MTPDARPLGSSRTPQKPCPFCGLVQDDSTQRCDRCRMPLDEASIRSLTALMGPWFVLDEQTPTAPGVTWQKFLSLIEKGKITPGVIVRGPATGGLWMPAFRAPSVATQLGLCWSCQSPLPPDPSLTECPQCQRRLNGPVNWPDPGPADSADQAAGESAGIEDADAASAIDDLIEAGARGTGGNGYANVRPPRSCTGLVVAGLVAAALICVGGIIYGATKILGAGHADRPSGGDVQARTDVRPDLAAAPAPAGAQPGELFPEVPAYTEPGPEKLTARDQRTLAQARFDQAGKYLRDGNLMAAQDVLVDMIDTYDPKALPKGAEKLLRDIQGKILAGQRAAGPSEADLARQRQAAQQQFDRADALAGQGKLLEAQVALVNTLNTYDSRAWPANAMATLRAIRERIRTSTRPTDVPTKVELGRQRRAARKLFRRAERLIAEGNLVAAQEPLLEILNSHHPNAWPAGTLEKFQEVKGGLRGAPASQPDFFGIEPRK